MSWSGNVERIWKKGQNEKRLKLLKIKSSGGTKKERKVKYRRSVKSISITFPQ